MAEYNSRRSGPEWLRLITECRQSGMPDNVWCEAYFRQKIICGILPGFLV